MGERVGLYGRPGQHPLDANAYGEMRDGDQSDTMLVRELQFILVELLSTSETSMERPPEGELVSYDDLLSELREISTSPVAEAPLGMTLPARIRQRRRATHS